VPHLPAFPALAALAALSTAGALAAGCGSRCAEVAAARDALTSRRGAADRRSDVRVTLSLAGLNQLFADSLRAQPLSVPLEPPELGPLQLASPIELTAVARDVELRPGPPGKVRFATRVEIRDAAEALTTLAVVAEVTPALERHPDGAELLIRFGADSLLSFKPELAPDSRAALQRAVARWLPAALRGRVPQALVDAAASRLGSHLLGAAYEHLRRTLLSRLGERTGLRLRLPDVPIAEVAVRSLEAPDAARSSSPATAVLLVDILTDLPVRRGLPDASTPGPAAPAAAPVDVQLSPSATAELATWAIEQGHLPRWYTRSLAPSPTGEFRPRFDHVAEDDHPFKIYAFQERGGCSYFRVGVQAELAMDGDHLKVTALDRQLEEASATPLLEVAAWVKYFLFGSLDLSRRVAAHTRLSIGGRSFESRVVAASLSREELRFGLALAVAPAPSSPAR
jgi:hypothetical protein